MFFGRWRQGTAEVSGWISLRSARRDRVAEYLSAYLMNPMGSLERAACFYTPQYRQQFGSANLTDRPSTEPREHVSL
jgi:hypothetical protein